MSGRCQFVLGAQPYGTHSAQTERGDGGSCILSMRTLSPKLE